MSSVSRLNVNHPFGRLDSYGGDRYLDGAELDEPLAELHARGGVLGGLAQRGALGAGQRGAHAEAPVVQDVHRHLRPRPHAVTRRPRTRRRRGLRVLGVSGLDRV